MGYNHVRSISGWIIIIGHVGIAILAVFKLMDYLEPKQIVDVLMVLSPITLAYFTAVIVTFVRGKYETKRGRRVNLNFAIISFLLPLSLIALLAVILLNYPNGLASDISSLQRWIAGIEVVLGTTVGLVVNDLFPTNNS